MTPAEQYADVRGRITDLVRDLDDERLALRVPGCPAWNVREVVAHVTGIVADANANSLYDVGGDEWTARQVADRRDAGLGDVLAEWAREAAVLEPKLDDWPKAFYRTLIVDLVTHEHDLRGALGEPGGRDSEAYAVGVKSFHVGLAKAIEERGLPGLRLAAADGWEFDAGPAPATTVTAPDRHELFRALAGRRSRGQVLAYDWSGDPEPYLGMFNHFGPLPDEDVVELA